MSCSSMFFKQGTHRFRAYTVLVFFLTVASENKGIVCSLGITSISELYYEKGVIFD